MKKAQGSVMRALVSLVIVALIISVMLFVVWPLISSALGGRDNFDVSTFKRIVKDIESLSPGESKTITVTLSDSFITGWNKNQGTHNSEQCRRIFKQPVENPNCRDTCICLCRNSDGPACAHALCEEVEFTRLNPGLDEGRFCNAVAITKNTVLNRRQNGVQVRIQNNRDSLLLTSEAIAFRNIDPYGVVPGTQILLADERSEKPIEEIEVGDQITGFCWGRYQDATVTRIDTYEDEERTMVTMQATEEHELIGTPNLELITGIAGTAYRRSLFTHLHENMRIFNRPLGSGTASFFDISQYSLGQQSSTLYTLRIRIGSEESPRSCSFLAYVANGFLVVPSQ